MNLKILFWIGLMALGSRKADAQSVSAQVLDAYFTALTRQHQVNTEISSNLRQLSPQLHQDYHQLLQLTDQDATLPWAYFWRKMERAGADEALLNLCRQGRKWDQTVRRYHNLRLVDPFSQNTIDTSQSIKRLLFFDLKGGEHVAEIGFGYGYNLHLLALGHQNATVYANELDAHRLQRMEQTIEEEYPATHREQFHFIPGIPGSTNLENTNLDLIIMENVFHHLLDQATFLESILNSLGESGEVVIIEEFLDADRQGGSCPDLMNRAELMVFFTEAGLKMLGEEALRKQHKTMLRFAKKRDVELDK